MLHRKITLLITLMLLAFVGSFTPKPLAAQAALPGAICFAETGFCAAGPIARFWERNGGLAVLGLPISPLLEVQVEGRPLRLQWFERARLELHPENAPPFDVQMGRLGIEALAAQGRDWRTFPVGIAPNEECRLFPETGQNICGAVLAAWRTNGLDLDGQPGVSEAESLALFGLPISPLQEERLGDGRSYQVQWFERARFELHPENAPPFYVQMGLLGRELRPGAAGHPVSQLAFGRCPFGIPRGVRVECATLVVPQDRSRPLERSIALAVAIFRDGAPAPDPILYLSGGPGSPALSTAPQRAGAWRSFSTGRDLIFIDQRGTGFSWPALRCPELDAFFASVRGRALEPRERLRGEADALLACRDRFERTGVAMATFNSAASAADLEELRVALGYTRWNVFGISYGTRLALTLLRDHPGGVRSLVLDSVYPPQANLYTAMPAGLDHSLRTLFSDCAASPRCAAAYPELERVFYELVDELNARPPLLQLNGTTVRFTGDQLVGTMFRLLYSSAALPRLPQMIYATRAGNFGPLRELLTQRGGSDGQAQAHYYAVQCAEELAFTAPEEKAAALAAYPRLAGFYASLLELAPEGEELCARFGVAPPEPRENEAVRGNVPALLLAGAYDPITTPAWRELAAQGLPASFGYTFPGTGHAVVGRGACPAALIRAFLNNPGSAPDTGCVARLGQPAFAVP